MTGEDTARRRLVADLGLVAAGNREAFRRVYDATSAKLLGVCLRVVPDRATAEDILQEVYVSVWEHASRFNAQRASPITWLCTIARNRAIDWRRAADRRTDGTELMLPVIETDDRGAADTMIETLDRERVALACLDLLATDQRSAIREAFLEGVTYRELATRRAVPVGTMKSWIRRGLLEMRKCLAE